jgi:putative SOS response-associated peptidase YedK
MIACLYPAPPSLAIRRIGATRGEFKDASIGSKMINARAETVATAPAFRSAFKKTRCLIPASGFYEWQKREDGTKQPMHIGMKDGAPFAFAGLWTTWGPKARNL